MNILAIDTAHQSCSIALIKNGEVKKALVDNESSKQAERLLTMMEDILKEFDLSYQDLDKLAVNNGPGSFTGVRIGMAAAKGIKLVCPQIKLVSISSLSALAQNIMNQNPTKDILSVIDARRNQVFCQVFACDGAEKTKIFALDLDKICEITSEQNIIITGSGAPLVSNHLQNGGINFQIIDHSNSPLALHIANIALISSTKTLSEQNFIPQYIRKPDAKKSTKL